MKESYLRWHGDADRRTKAGQRQYQCVCCKKWHWWDERKGHRFKVIGKLREGKK